MPQPYIARAVLIPMNGDQVETNERKHIPVQFNPASLRVTLTNTVRADNRGGSSDAAAQYVNKSESSLSVELLFDTSRAVGPADDRPPRSPALTAAANSDVRILTGRIAEAFMKPEAANADNPPAPKRCRFQWGSFRFTGMLASYNETLDFFAPEGIPLRATLALTFKEDRYQFERDEDVRAAERETPRFAAGGAGVTADRAAQSAGRDPRDWRDVARFNGLENPRQTPSTGLAVPPAGLPLPGAARARS